MRTFSGPTADDITALNVLFACQRNAIPVPDRLAITGFCDLPNARNVYPSLTTVRVPADEIGREAARLILERVVRRTNESITLVLGFEFIKRMTA